MSCFCGHTEGEHSAQIPSCEIEGCSCACYEEEETDDTEGITGVEQ